MKKNSEEFVIEDNVFLFDENGIDPGDHIHDPLRHPFAQSTEISLDHFISAGMPPMGPVCLWPKARHLASLNSAENPDRWDTKEEVDSRIRAAEILPQDQATKVNASKLKMLKGLASTASQALRGGRVSSEIREERWKTCQSCPALVKKSKRCSECGCFMEAKTWVNGNAKALCPLQKWDR